MKSYIYTTRNDIHILDLEKTKKGLLKAAAAAADIVTKGGTILFIGTKRQSSSIMKKHALECGMPFINVRWLGGTFTNFKTIQKTVRKLEKIYELKASGELETRYTKKERLLIEREGEKLEKLFEGIKGMRRLPEAVFIADVNYDDIALTEAKKAGVKIIAIVDSNSNPDNIDYVIPCNDDATQAIELVVGFVAQSIKDAKASQVVAQAEPAPAAAPTDPVPTAA